MKAKARLRRFWRHNKRQSGLWCTLFVLILAATPPYGLTHISFDLIMAVFWIIIWHKDRTLDTYNRLHKLVDHNVDKVFSIIKDNNVSRQDALDAMAAYCKHEYGTEPDLDLLRAMMQYDVKDVGVAKEIIKIEKK